MRTSIYRPLGPQDRYGPWVYESPDTRHWTRLFYITEGYRYTLKCFMKQVDLKHTGGYTALSYTWGAPTPARSIDLEEREQPWSYNSAGIGTGEHLIGQNLYDFLLAFTIQPWGRSAGLSHLWVDQICINQSDVHERSYQIGFMNQIYRGASKVLIWLGCRPDMVKAARQLRGKTEHESALTTILSHPYFSRVWVVQEVLLSNTVSIVCGDVELEWNRVQTAVTNSYFKPRGVVLESGMKLITEKKQYRTLQHCISKYCTNSCQDSRDKVYGLLGFTAERWRIRVDYTKTVLDVYIDAVMALHEELLERISGEYDSEPTLPRPALGKLYLDTCLLLGKEMDLPELQLNGLDSFLQRLQEIYLATSVRNITYACELRLPYSQSVPSVKSGSLSCDQIPIDWRIVYTATRRYPLVHDVVKLTGLSIETKSEPL